MKTRITELFGIQYPIIQGAMQCCPSPAWLPPCPTPGGWVPSI